MRYKIALDFKDEILEYDVIHYELEGNFLILSVDDEKLYFNTNKLDYFKVTPVYSELDAEDFWTKY